MAGTELSLLFLVFLFSKTRKQKLKYIRICTVFIPWVTIPRSAFQSCGSTDFRLLKFLCPVRIRLPGFVVESESCFFTAFSSLLRVLLACLY